METPTLSAAPAETTLSARPGRLAGAQEIGLGLVVLLLGTVLAVYGWHDAARGRPNTFLNSANFIDGIATPMSYYAIMAVGLTVVIITGGIDISVGSTMALSALGAAAALQGFSLDAPAWQVLPVAAVVPLAMGLACGLVNGGLVVGLNLHPFIVTLGTTSVFRGLANVLPSQKTLPAAGKRLPEAFTTHFMRVKVFGLEPMPLAIMLGCVALGWFYLRLMVAGRETYALGGNEEAARFSGVATGAVKLRTYALAGLCAGLAGMVSVGRFGTASTSTGSGYELTVIAAAVVGGASLLGGRGTALGALLGTVAILAGNQSALNLQRRVEGAKAALARHPGVKLNEPGVFYHVETPEKAAEEVQNAQNANPGITGWCLIGGWPLFTADALKWPPGSIKVGSCDALPAELNYLRDGYVDVLYAQDCYGWGHQSVEILLEKIVNKHDPPAVVIIDPLTAVTRANVEEYAHNWDKWLARKH